MREERKRAEDVQEEDLPGSDWPPAAVTAYKKGSRKNTPEELKIELFVEKRNKKEYILA